MGKDDDFADFVSSRWLTAVRTAMALGCSLADAEDLAQTAFLRAYVAWTKVVNADRPDAYFSRILVNAHRDTYRLRWRREAPVADLPDMAADDETAASESADALRRALANLSQGQREVVALRYFVRLTESEIAATFGLSSRLQRLVPLPQRSAPVSLWDLRRSATFPARMMSPMGGRRSGTWSPRLSRYLVASSWFTAFLRTRSGLDCATAR